jgi:hypothetical protein
MKKSLYIVISCILFSITQANAVTVVVKREASFATFPPGIQMSLEALPNNPNRYSVNLPEKPNETTTAQWPDGHYAGLRLVITIPHGLTLWPRCVDPNGERPWVEADKGFTTKPDQTMTISLKGRGTDNVICVFENSAEFMKK